MKRTGYYPYRPAFPYVEGYEVVGDVDAIGDGVSGFAFGQRVCALTVYGAWAEYFTRDADDFVSVPQGLDDAEVVALILNYATAYQMIHRIAAMKPRQTALVTGANGGVGTALLELLRSHDVRVLGLVSRKHFDLVRNLGGEPIESRTTPVEIAVHEVLPGGVDVAFDGLGGARTRECIRAVRRGGLVVGYGFVAAQGIIGTLRGVASLYLGARVAWRRGAFYGITALYRKDKHPFKEDLPKLFELLAAQRIQPRIAARLPSSRVARPNAFLKREALLARSSCCVDPSGVRRRELEYVESGPPALLRPHAHVDVNVSSRAWDPTAIQGIGTDALSIGGCIEDPTARARRAQTFPRSGGGRLRAAPSSPASQLGV